MSNRTDNIISLTEENLQCLINCIKDEMTVQSVDKVYPVGYVYVTSKAPTDGGDPNVLFPGTTWVLLPTNTYLCAAKNTDTVDDMPQGSNTRTALDLPNHQHKLASSVNSAGEFSGTTRLLYSAYSGTTVTGNMFIVSASGGNWYGDNRSPKNTNWCKFSLKIPSHTHTITIEKNVGYSSMDIQPKHLYKYMWERTA